MNNSATNLPSSSSGTSISNNLWSHPERVEIIEWDDSIEFIYKQTSMITYSIHPSPPPEIRVFKIIFSCVDGKWNKSEPIFGKIIPKQEEGYEFD